MNTICTLSLVLLFVSGISHAEQSPNLPGGNTIVTFCEQIPGTTLVQSGCNLRDATGEWQQFSVGYIKQKGGSEGTFVPVLKLPDLLGDEYTVKVDSGVLRIGTAKTKKVVLALHLQNICPALITSDFSQTESDKSGTKPAGKIHEEIQPPTPPVKHDSR